MSDARIWTTIVLCAMVTFAIKGAGPAALGARHLPAPLARVVALLAPALIAALVVTNALTDGRALHAGAATVGVTAAFLLLWRGGSVLAAVVVAVLLTAGLRAAGLS